MFLCMEIGNNRPIIQREPHLNIHRYANVEYHSQCKLLSPRARLTVTNSTLSVIKRSYFRTEPTFSYTKIIFIAHYNIQSIHYYYKAYHSKQWLSFYFY